MPARLLVARSACSPAGFELRVFDSAASESRRGGEKGDGAGGSFNVLIADPLSCVPEEKAIKKIYSICLAARPSHRRGKLRPSSEAQTLQPIERLEPCDVMMRCCLSVVGFEHGARSQILTRRDLKIIRSREQASTRHAD